MVRYEHNHMTRAGPKESHTRFKFKKIGHSFEFRTQVGPREYATFICCHQTTGNFWKIVAEILFIIMRPEATASLAWPKGRLWLSQYHMLNQELCVALIDVTSSNHSFRTNRWTRNINTQTFGQLTISSCKCSSSFLIFDLNCVVI